MGKAMVSSYEKANFHAWEWKEPPVIVNCYGEDFYEVYIVEAVNYWTVRGFDFAFIEQNPSEKICKHNKLKGFIILKKKTLHHSTLAMCERQIVGLSINSAVIYFSPGSFKIQNV